MTPPLVLDERSTVEMMPRGATAATARVSLLVTVDVDITKLPIAAGSTIVDTAPSLLASEVVSNLESVDYVVGVPAIGVVAFDPTRSK